MSGTIKAPPPTVADVCLPEADTGPISQGDRVKADAAIAIRDAVELQDEASRAMLHAQYRADAALGMTADEEARRVPSRLERIERDLATLLEISRKNAASIGILIDSYREHRTRISAIEANPKLSLVPSAQEAE